MYDSRHNELEKLMNLMNKLNKELQLIKKDISSKESKSKELVSYMEQEIKENTKSIKELENPFLLFIMGLGNYGKSTLINALLQEKVIETSDIPNTWKLDLFIKSDNEKVEITYNDEREIVKSLSRGKKILKEEEDKFKTSKKEISKKILNYKNKLSKDKLKEFKIEQEKLYLYKSDIDQIKYYLNNKKILNDFTIVDTPGLNQTLLKNTIKRMNTYYQKADGVIWLIDAQNIVSKETNKLIEEINKIDNLHEKKIIGVVNKIDIIKNDKDLERLKEKVNEIYNNKFNDIVYISARDALDGIINKDKYLINKSNINSLYKSIDKNFKQICEKKQIDSKYKNLSIMKENLLYKIYSYKRDLYKDISDYNEIEIELNKSCDDIYLYALNHMNKFKRKKVYNKNDFQLLRKSIEDLEQQCNKSIEKNYNILIKKAYSSNIIKNTINTKVYFSKSKYLVINYNNFTNIKRNNKLSHLIDQFTKENSTKVVNDEVALSNYIHKNITYLEDEIMTTLKYKLDCIKDNVNEVKYDTFKNKYLDYFLIKDHIKYLDNIENILINLR
ncbi:P-loop containing nucleoside triphosphate hydrolase [Romboutsia ilealis]|uniref:GTPase Era n=1 Tax=Romboutsia ilealis TaxID=1115758 RepID=A0A1V1I1T3_9FIRM|nr:dynamin family protein [Romboutsia ilealis]CED94113.1 P-loop containing nucleoside triphosphate hydrolase [Romboutsia ilealis]